MTWMRFAVDAHGSADRGLGPGQWRRVMCTTGDNSAGAGHVRRAASVQGRRSVKNVSLFDAFMKHGRTFLR